MAYDDVVESIKVHGPCTGDEYVNDFSKKGGSRVNGRKRLSRALAKGVIASLELTLPNNAKIYFIPDQRLDGRFNEKLTQILKRTNSAYWKVMAGLITRGGAATYAEHAIVSGAPVKKRKGQVLYSTLIEQMRKERLIFVREHEGTEYVTLSPDESGQLRDIRKRLRRRELEEVVLEALGVWLKRNGFVSHDSIRLGSPSQDAEWGGYSWNLTAPTYLKGFSKRDQTGVIPGFVVADIHVGNVTGDHIAYFLRKCDAISALPNNRTFLPILLVGFVRDKEAFREARSKGCLCVTLSQFLGANLARRIRLLSRLFSPSFSIKSADAKELSDVLNELGKVGINVQNLRGDLFELMVVAWAHKRLTEVNRSQKGASSLGKYEIDVVGVEASSGRHIYIECKAYMSPIPVEELERWIETRIPRILEDSAPTNPKFEFWAVNGLADEARSYFNQMKSLSDVEMEVKEGKEVKHELRSVGLGLETLLSHYKINKSKRNQKDPRKEQIGRWANKHGYNARDCIHTIDQALVNGELDPDIDVETCLDFLAAVMQDIAEPE